MKHRFVAPGAVTIVVVAVSLAAISVGCQAPTATAKPSPPRTADGRSDLQGVWNYSTITPMSRPSELAGKALLTDQEAAEYEKTIAERFNKPPSPPVPGDGPGAYDARVWSDRGKKVAATKRTSLVVNPADGRIPPLTPEAEMGEATHLEARLRSENPEDRDVAERCLVGDNSGPPIVPGNYNNNVQIFQTRDHVAFLNEQIHTARIVPTDERPHRNIRQWRGDSRGRWEGSTLIVDTTNFADIWHTSIGNKLLRGSWGSMHLVERFTRVDSDTLLYEYTIEDPKTYTSPWTVQLPMTKVEGPLYEYACHEGNYGMAGILSGARTEEKANGPDWWTHWIAATEKKKK
jgi:hypothetical protein